MYKNKVYILILATTAFRFMIANTIELYNDEVYYWTYPLHLQMNYFDHPPIVALLIRITTLNLFLQQEIFLRCGAIMGAAAGTWLSYSIGKKIKNERTGWFAALLYNSSIYSSIIAGVFILPDSPQIIFWLLGLRIALNFAIDNNKNPSIKTWILWGVYTGICIMCKVHGVFLWIGLGLYIITYKRNLLTQRFLYISLIITLLIISPIFIWNWLNNFVTWQYHSSRVAVHSISFDKDSFILAVIGQIAYNNPLNVFLIVQSILFYRKQKSIKSSINRLLLFLGLPLIIVVTSMSMFNAILPHWSGPGFMTLQFLAASYLDDKSKATCVIPHFIKYAIWLVVITITVGLVFITYYPGTIGSKKGNELGSGDFTLDLYGWSEVGADFGKWMKQAKSDNILPANNTIVCNKWFPASHIDYYIARKNKMQVIGIGTINDLHHYVWLNLYRNDLKKGDSAICIIPSNYSVDLSSTYLNYFMSVQLIHIITSERMHTIVRYFKVYLLKGYLGNDEAHNILVK